MSKWREITPLYSIGVDPGENTGVAIFNRETRTLVSVHTTDFLGVRAIIYPYKNECRVFVELPGEKMYGRNEKYSDRIDNRERAARDKHLINIGENRGNAKCTFKLLIQSGYDAALVEPIGAKKRTLEQFQRDFNLTWTCNQHERDAARLAAHWGGKNLQK